MKRTTLFVGAGVIVLLCIWQLHVWTRGEDGQRVLKADKISVDCVVFTNDGQYLVTGGTDNAVKAWDLTRMQIDHVLQTHVGNITALAISPSGGLLAVGGTSNEVELWDNQNYYRAFSLINGGRQVEDDLFAGLR